MFGRKRKGDSGLDKIRETTDLAVDVENLVVKYVRDCGGGQLH